MDETTYRERFFKDHNGKTIWSCIQCGTCSGSCPLGNRMDHAPRALFALIRDGEMALALRSNTPWYCVSCYQCTVRCPQEIPVTELMYALKQMASEAGLAPASHKIPDLYRAFQTTVEQFGRVTDPLVMARYGIGHPLDAVRQTPLALRLLRKKRLELKPQRVCAPEQFSHFIKMLRKRRAKH